MSRLWAQHAELVSLFSDGVMSERVYHELAAELDSALAFVDASVDGARGDD